MIVLCNSFVYVKFGVMQSASKALQTDGYRREHRGDRARPGAGPCLPGAPFYILAETHFTFTENGWGRSRVVHFSSGFTLLITRYFG